jgi:hypothetical protein
LSLSQEKNMNRDGIAKKRQKGPGSSIFIPFL